MSTQETRDAWTREDYATELVASFYHNNDSVIHEIVSRYLESDECSDLADHELAEVEQRLYIQSIYTPEGNGDKWHRIVCAIADDMARRLDAQQLTDLQTQSERKCQ